MNLGSVNVKITALPFLLATSGGAAFLPAYLQLLNNKAGEVRPARCYLSLGNISPNHWHVVTHALS